MVGLRNRQRIQDPDSGNAAVQGDQPVLSLTSNLRPPTTVRHQAGPQNPPKLTPSHSQFHCTAESKMYGIEKQSCEESTAEQPWPGRSTPGEGPAANNVPSAVLLSPLTCALKHT